MNDEIMTAKEAAAFLKVCRQTFAKLDVPAMPLKGTRVKRYLKGSILQWLEQDPRPKWAMASKPSQGAVATFKEIR
jgi:hypothetical protein